MSNAENVESPPAIIEVRDNFGGTRPVSSSRQQHQPILDINAVPKYLFRDLTPYPGSVITAGGYGAVSKVFHPLLGQAALKQLLQTAVTGDQIKYWTREVEAVYHCNHHPNIVILYGYAYNELTDPRPTGILMEYMNGGTIYSHVIQNRPSVVLKNTWAKQIALGLNFIHSRNRMHRDFKPDNILLSQNGYLAKIADFGCSRTIDPSATITMCMGNPIYAAPEVYMETELKNYTESADVWSYGMVLYFIYYGKNPYDKENLRKVPAFKRVAAWNGDEVHPRWSHRPHLDGQQEINTIIQECWKTKPEMRCTMTQVVNFFHNSEGVQLFPSFSV